MGAFVIARLDIFKNRPIARRMAQKGAEAGHIPSKLLLERLRHRKVKKYFYIFTLPSIFIFAIRSNKLLVAGLKDKDNLYMRFWRYKDLGMQVDKELAKALPIDRAYPFEDIEAALSD